MLKPKTAWPASITPDVRLQFDKHAQAMCSNDLHTYLWAYAMSLAVQTGTVLAS